MPINFHDAACQESTTDKLFGLCDAPPPPYTPAYINKDTVNKPNWIAEVINNDSKEVTFTAIDNCIEILRADGTAESRCEGMLTYDKTIIFLELKNRTASGWLAKARDQLKITILLFEQNNDMSNYDTKRAHIANAQRPFFHSNYSRVIDEIKTETGFITEVKAIIEIT